ncbi:hypothetical protein A2U01_0094431, partial [Trifolium medium]|nr:hypothetical protein [Trifolium medium]
KQRARRSATLMVAQRPLKNMHVSSLQGSLSDHALS